MTNNDVVVGANAKRLIAVVVAAVVGAVLAAAVGAGVLGPPRPASAQTTSPLAIGKEVYPSPQNAIPVGTHMDFLITEYNNSRRTQRGVTVTDTLPAGVTYVAAYASQGSCYPMADRPAVYCELGTIRRGNVAHVNIIVRATRPGTYTNVAQDNLGNQAALTYTVVPRLLR